jgi:tetratricopeptide (TPR) repeat protein
MRFLALSLIVIGLMASTASARIWTDATGQGKIEAEYMGIEAGMVKLELRPSGRIVSVALGTLSEADQQWVNEQVAKAEAEAQAAAGPPDRFTQAIMDDPTNPSNYINRGMALTSCREFDAAVRDFTKAIELAPEDPHAYNGRGLAYHRGGDLIAAQKDFNEAIKRDPKLISAYKNRGENLRQLALDKTRSVPELDEEIERWSQFWNFARQANLRNTPWQPLNSTKGDVSRPMVLQQMANTDFEFARTLEHDYGWDYGHDGGHGGHGGHGRGCNCPACSGHACPHCNDRGCAACNGGKPAPGLGVYPPQVMKGETITLVANAATLSQGMPTEAKPGQKPGPNAPQVAVDSVDFYRDVDGDGNFNATSDQFLGADAEGKDGFSLEVSTAAFPPGPQSYFAVPRGAPGSGTGATPEEMMAAADKLAQAAQTQQGIAEACGQGAAQGLSADESKGLNQDQATIADECAECADQAAAVSPELAEMLDEAKKPMNAVKNLMNTAQKRPGEASKGDAEKAAAKAGEAAEKLAELAAKMREAAEAAKASTAENPGQAPANAAAGAPTSGANEILAAAPIGPRGVGPGAGPGGDDGGDQGYEEEVVVTEEIIEDEVLDRAQDYIADHDYDNAVLEYDRVLSIDPLNADFLRDRAATQLLRGSYERAVRDYDRLLTIQPEPDANLYYNRGCAHLAAGRLDEALSDFTKSISLNEVWSLAYNNRGATYARLRQYDKAVADFTKAIELEPGNSLAYRNRALAYRKLGETQKAQDDLEYMIRLEKVEAAGNVR